MDQGDLTKPIAAIDSNIDLRLHRHQPPAAAKAAPRAKQPQRVRGCGDWHHWATGCPARCRPRCACEGPRSGYAVIYCETT